MTSAAKTAGDTRFAATFTGDADARAFAAITLLLSRLPVLRTMAPDTLTALVSPLEGGSTADVPGCLARACAHLGVSPLDARKYF